MVLQPYDMEVGAGTFHPATTLRALGPDAWRSAVRAAEPPSHRRPLRREPEPPAALLPVPGDPEAEPGRRARPVLRLASRHRHRARRARHAPRGRRLGVADARCVGSRAGKCGSTAWRSRSSPTSSRSAASSAVRFPAEITYGLERLAMYIQGVDCVYDLVWSGPTGYVHLRRRLPAQRAAVLGVQLRARRTGHAPRPLRPRTRPSASACLRRGSCLPAYDYVLKCSHDFNLLDARGAIAVTERVSFILRVRTLAKACCEAYDALVTEGGDA